MSCTPIGSIRQWIYDEANREMRSSQEIARVSGLPIRRVEAILFDVGAEAEPTFEETRRIANALGYSLQIVPRKEAAS